MVCQYLLQQGIESLGKNWFGKNQRNLTFRVNVPDTYVQTVMDIPKGAERPWGNVNKW
jgi:hypothetical protein